MRSQPAILSGLVLAMFSFGAALPAPSVDPAATMHWRQIGPSRAGRARALAGVPSQPNVFYIGFDKPGRPLLTFRHRIAAPPLLCKVGETGGCFTNELKPGLST